MWLLSVYIMNPEVLNDLSDLISSDTECFVDICENEKSKKTTNVMTCHICNKDYKRRNYYDMHMAKCTGKRIKLPVPDTQGREYSCILILL